MRVIQAKNRKYCFMLEMEVRDYELDCEQIVNNSNYLRYMEHTRHKFCQDAGLPFFEMHTKGIDAVVRRIEIEYFAPLRSMEKFVSCLSLERKGPRYIFHQDIVKQSGEIAATAEITTVITKDGKLTRGDELVETFGKYL